MIPPTTTGKIDLDNEENDLIEKGANETTKEVETLSEGNAHHPEAEEDSEAERETLTEEVAAIKGDFRF